MTSSELKELVKKHFSLVEVDATSEEIVNEEITEEFTEETVEEVFGEIADENDAFVIKFPGDSLQIGDKVVVVTKEGQEMDAPNGEHKLIDGTIIVTEDSVVKEIKREEADTREEMAADEDAVEEVVEEVVEDAMEEEAAPSIEDIVEEIVGAVKEEMGKMKEKMAELEEKVAGIADAPAAEPVMKKGPETQFKKSEKFASFDVSKAKNADRIEAAIKAMKNKK